MGWQAAAIMGGTSLLGGILGGNAAENAAQTSANAQLQAGQMAAEAAKFRPVGVTSRFGSSQFGFDPQGYLASAGYQASPELLGYQNFLSGQGAQTQQDVSGLLGLGRGYLATSPEQARQQYIQDQTALVAPQQEQQLAGIRNRLFQTGRGGLATGATESGNLAATNPEMAAYYNSIANQQRQIAAGAEQAAQQRIGFGQGLLSSAYSPLQTNVGLNAELEKLAQSPLDIGAQLGGRAATAGSSVGQSLLSSGISAAKTAQAGQFDPLSASLMGAGMNPYLGYAANQYFNPAQTAVTAPLGLGGYGTGANYGFGSASNYSLPSAGGYYGLQPSGGLGLTGIWGN